ncbi:MAG: response regulator [Planctomycetes bacterium]|nr:response regulator [Planctomycetota bacterium]
MLRSAPLLALLACVPVLALHAAEQPNVLVLLSYHRGMPWEDGVVRGMQEALAGIGEPVYVDLDVKRFPDRARVPAVLAVAQGLVAAARPSVVVAVDDHAWETALAERDRLFAGLPLVFCGVNYWDGATRPPDSTGVVEGTDPAATVRLAFRLHPQARRLVVVNDPTETGRQNRLLLDRVLPPEMGGREVLWLGDGTFADTDHVLAGLDPRRDVVLAMSSNLDAAGAVRSYDQAAARIRSVCPAPVYAAWDLYYDKRMVGGYLLDAPTHGRRTGELVARILRGEHAHDIPVDTRPSTRLSLDDRELQRFGVDERLIPAEAEILHRPESFWRAYGATVAVVTAVFLLQLGTIAGLLVAMRRRRLAEEAAREGELRLRHGARMDAVGQLAAGVAHDFNNVLTAILGHADLLAMRLEKQSELRPHVETIAGAAQRAAGTVRNLLAFARGRSGGAKSCDANRLVQDVVSLLQHAIDRRIAVSCDLDPGAGAVRIGGDELQQMLINLALNARDAMGQGGRLELATRRIDVQEDARSLGLEPGWHIRITVADTGIGIAPEHIERIFDPFFTTKDVGKGTGLGLSVVHGAVRSAHGAIRVASRVGEGTTFTIWLPASDRVSSAHVPVVRAPRALRVMLVDDEQLVLSVVGQLLEACGATVHSFDDPLRASTWFAGNGNDVDVALLDGNMPGMTGWQLAIRLREARPDLRVVALTGAATAEATAAWHAAGVNRLLHKPVTREQLAETLLQVGGEATPTPGA